MLQGQSPTLKEGRTGVFGVKGGGDLEEEWSWDEGRPTLGLWRGEVEPEAVL